MQLEGQSLWKGGEKMNKPNILLGRIDNRLMHGQVGGVWVRYIGANLVIVADDAVAQDSLQQSLMKMVANAVGNVQMRFFTLQKTIDVIWNASPDQKIFILTRTPKEMRTLIENNVPIPQVNVGNLHASEEKTQLTSAVFLGEQDVQDLMAIKERGVKVYLQTVPNTDKTEFKGL